SRYAHRLRAQPVLHKGVLGGLREPVHSIGARESPPARDAPAPGPIPTPVPNIVHPFDRLAAFGF
ncbi:MAG: hypothetical protein QF395_09745, partial [Arenicellales bacterium]|nr:hypothetical protein [Arenicellales bacterium]